MSVLLHLIKQIACCENYKLSTSFHIFDFWLFRIILYFFALLPFLCLIFDKYVFSALLYFLRRPDKYTY